MISVNQNPLRPIHYLGSKLRLLDFIEDAVNDISPNGKVCDLFAGTGSVSYRLSKNHEVTAVDIQEYSKVLSSALLFKPKFKFKNPNEYINRCRSSKYAGYFNKIFKPMVEYEESCIRASLNGDYEPLCELIEKGSIVVFEQSPYTEYSSNLLRALKETLQLLRSSKDLDKNSTVATKYFGGLYFSYKQAQDIDLLLQFAFEHEHQAETRNALLAPVLSTASEVVNTIGKQFAQPINPRQADGSPKKNLGKMVSRDRKLDVFKIYETWLSKYMSLDVHGSNHSVYRKDFAEALDSLNPATEIIYADPPYTRDHYSRFYHVLETLCLRDNPQISTSTIGGVKKLSRGLYRSDRHQSPFCIKSQAPKAFDTLISKSRKLNSSLLISYSPYDESVKSHPRTMTIEELTGLANKYYGSVEILTLGDFSHSKLNSIVHHLPSSKNAEILIVCKV